MLLTLCMVMSLFAGTTVTASAASAAEGTNDHSSEGTVRYEPLEISADSLNGNAIWGLTETWSSSITLDDYAAFYAQHSNRNNNAGGLPVNGSLTTTNGTPYQLATGGDEATAYDGNDCIRLYSGSTSVTMNLQTIGVYQNIYVLATAGGPGKGHYAKFNVTLNYTDGTKGQTTYKLYDWYDTSAVIGVEKYYPVMRRVNGSGAYDGTTGTSDGPILQSATIEADTTKLLKSITFNLQGKNDETDTRGLYCGIFAVTGATPAGVPDAPVATAATKTEGDTSGAFTANWDSVEGAIGYQLDVATDRKFTNILNDYNNKDVGNVNSFKVENNIDTNTTYYYRVRAVNSSGQSLSSNRISTALPIWLKAALNSSDYDNVTYNAETNTVTFGKNVTLRDTITLPTDDTTVINLGSSTVTAPAGKPAISAGTGSNVELTVTGDGTSGSLVGKGTTESGDGAPVIDFTRATGSSKVAVGNSALSGSSGSNTDSGKGGSGGAGIAANNNTQVEVGSGAKVTGGNGGNGAGGGGSGGAGISGGNVSVSSGGTVTNGNPGSTHIHSWVYTASENKIMAYCAAQGGSGCNYQGAEKAVTLTLTATNADYSGSAYIGASMTNNITPVTKAAAGSIFYKGTGTTIYESSATPPTVCGTYQASVTVGGQTATADFMITQRTIHPSVTMADYEYGTTPSTPVINADQGDGAVTYYYSTYSDIATNPAHRIVWDGMTETPLQAGTYYMVAHVAGTDNCKEGTTALITFKVTLSPYAKPTAPTVSDFTVTIDKADREKKLEYSLDNNNWVAVPALNSSGSFDLTGLAENTNYTVYLRQKASADGNYAASASVSANFTTPTRYSVAYNANYGSGTVPASVTQNSGSSVTVASGSGLWRTGYTFAGWNTVAKPTNENPGTSYALGSTISTGATLYAQWTANSYTVKFNANGGTGTMENQSLTYDAAATALSANGFTKDSFHFAGWATSAGGSAVYSDKQSVKNLASDGSVTLYAVWVQNVYGISGTITGVSDADVTVKLMRGTTEVASRTVRMTGSTSYTGTYDFSNIPAGTYNIVSTQVVSGKTRTVTALVVVTEGDQTENVTVPSGDTNSVLDVKENTRPVVVGGLDVEAETKAEESKTVTVTMTVEKQEEQQLPNTASPAEQQTQEAIAEIKAKTPGKTLEFMDIEVQKEVKSGESVESTEKLTQTNTVMEIVIPYDMAGKNNITVYRYHDGTAETFTESTAKTDGTFYLDRENNLIYVYAQKFSTYAIGYTVPSSSGGSGSSGSSSGNSSTISTPSAKNGTVSVSPKSASKGTTVTVTVTPDKGYVLETLTVTDASGKKLDLKNLGSGKYSFTMPASKVEVKATFMEDNTMLNYFVDVPASAYYYDAVLWAAEQGITGGTDATHFSPDGVCTRAQAVTFLWRAAGSPAPSATAMPFTDVAADSYYYNAVLWAMENGITVGTSSTTFSPDLKCSRAHIMTILWRSEKSPAAGSVNPFTDVSADAYYADAVLWAVKESVTNGTSSATFSPDADCTRAQIVTFIWRTLAR